MTVSGVAHYQVCVAHYQLATPETVVIYFGFNFGNIFIFMRLRFLIIFFCIIMSLKKALRTIIIHNVINKTKPTTTRRP